MQSKSQGQSRHSVCVISPADGSQGMILTPSSMLRGRATTQSGHSNTWLHRVCSHRAGKRGAPNALFWLTRAPPRSRANAVEARVRKRGCFGCSAIPSHLLHPATARSSSLAGWTACINQILSSFSAAWVGEKCWLSLTRGWPGGSVPTAHALSVFRLASALPASGS